MQYLLWSLECAAEYRMAAAMQITKYPWTSQNAKLLLLFLAFGRSVLPSPFPSFALKWGLTRVRSESVDGSVSEVL